MAGILVDVLLERLATLALEKIEGELKLVRGVKQEIQKLKQKVEAIQAVLDDAEQRQEMEAGVKLWLNELNDVSFDMDNVLDEWITRVEKHQMEKQERQSAEAHVPNKKKVCFPCPSSCFRFGQVDYQLFLRHEIAAKINELNERLALIDQNKQSFSFQTITRAVPELPQRSKTTSLPNVKIFGRDNEKYLIISKLLSESSERNEVPLIIPIVGMGGMGKTSLAQLVYNNEKIKSHFDQSIWVCVSDPFDDIKIAKAILERLGKNNTSNSLIQLVKTIHESIKGKKFLLVLDDVWNPKPHQWEELIKPLHNGAMGSRILVTTRIKEVAALMKATKQMISLEGLGEELCLKLFYYSAGIDEGDERSLSEEIQNIGLKLVKKCKGLPLAAKTLGSLMRNKTNVREWETVLNSKIWELKEIQQYVFLPLLLSYQDLTPATKRCILYCAIYPKDYVYDVNTLIESWMSQDYLNVKESRDKIHFGQNVFNNLVMRSFFQDIKVDEMNGNISCKIHDIVHDFLQYLTKTECLILNVELGASETKEHAQLTDKIRHLTLWGSLRVEESDSFKSFLRNCKKLRTLTAFKSDSFGLRLVESILKLKCLRTMTLRGRGEIPQSIGELIHLRYLDLSDYKLEELPSAMGSLYNLQTLRLHNCESLRKLDVRKLINLRHLYVDGCDSLWLIEGIEKLLDLQRLNKVRVSDGGNKLDHLKDLNQLRGSLRIEIKEDSKMAENAAGGGGGFMVNKSHLLELILFFYINGDGVAQREMMNVLEPHPGLESLAIYDYQGLAFSDWLSSSLHSLRFLNLDWCRNCKNMPPLGKLASLESLSIWCLDGVSKVGVEFLGITEQAASSSSTSAFISFPKLQKLSFKFMESWEEWEGVVEEHNSDKKNITIMPRLSQLTIADCNKLKALPDFLWNTPLQKLEIISSPILQNLYAREIGEQWVKISHIPNIKIGGWW